MKYSHINIIFKEFDNTFKKNNSLLKNNSLFELFLNEGGVWDDIISYLEEDDKKLYKLNKLRFKYIYENCFLNIINSWNNYTNIVISELEDLYVNILDSDICYEFYNKYINLLGNLLNNIISIEVNSSFSTKIKDSLEKNKIYDKINEQKDILKKKSFEVRLIKKTETRLEEIKKDIIKLDNKIINDLPRTKELKEESYNEIIKELQIVCDNYDKIQRNSSKNLKHSLLNFDLMMNHFRALSGKFTGSQVNKNKDSDLSYY